MAERYVNGEHRVINDRLSDGLLREPCTCSENPDGFWTNGETGGTQEVKCLACGRRWSPD
jgi:hypothetical protein